MTACVNSLVCTKMRDCEWAKPYMCAHKKKTSLFYFSLTSAHLREIFGTVEPCQNKDGQKRLERDRGPRNKEPLRRQLETQSMWFPPEYSCIHMCLTFLPSLSVSVFLALFFYCSLVLLFSCSRSQRRLSQLVVLTDFCGNACVSLSLDVCFAPVLVMLLLGCGKIINMGCRLEEGVGWS